MGASKRLILVLRALVCLVLACLPSCLGTGGGVIKVGSLLFFSFFCLSVILSSTSGKKQKNEKKAIQTDPWWLHNRGCAMQAFPGALWSHFFPFFLFVHPPDVVKCKNGKTGGKTVNHPLSSLHAFAAAAPHLLAFVRGPSVSGKKERLAAWLESKLRDTDPSPVSSW